PLARGSRQERAVPRPVPQRRDHRAARHRPGLPARRARGPHPAHPRALRARPLRARGGLPDLPGQGRHPGARQGARPAARGDRAGGARLGGVRRLQGGRRHPPRARGGARGRRALGLAHAPGRRGPRPAPAPLPALGRDDRRHPLARGLLRRGARRHGGPADGHVGQGLLRGRGLPEDRPPRARDALGGRALRGAHREPAQRAHRPVADPLRRPGGVRGDPARGDHGGLPDRVARADGLAPAHPPREPRRPDDPGGDRPARADPGRRGEPVHRAPPEAAGRPALRRALRPPVARARPARHAGHDHLPGPGHRGGDGLRRLLARRGRGPAAGDEPQALRGGHPRLPRPLRAGRPAHPRRGGGGGRARLPDDRRLLGLRLPQGPRGGVRAAGLPVDVAAGPLRARVPVRAARRAAHGLLSARLARPRGPAPRHHRAAAGRQRVAGGLHGGGPAGGPPGRRAAARVRRLHRGAGRARWGAAAAGSRGGALGRPHRPGLRARRPRGRDRRARGRPRGGRAVRLRRGPRGAGRRGASVARAPGVVRGVRRARGAGGPHAGTSPPRGAVAPGGRGSRDAAAGARRGTRADVGGRDAARPAAAAAVRAGAARARHVGRDDRRLRDHRGGDALASRRAAARGARPPRRRRLGEARAGAAPRAGAGRRPGGRPPEARHREGHRLHAPGGRGGDDQPHRAPRDLRPRPPGGADGAARGGRGPPRAPPRGRRAGQRPRRPGPAARGARPADGADQGLLPARPRRARAHDGPHGGARGRPGGRGRRGPRARADGHGRGRLPRGRSAGHVLRAGAAAV
ncbi:MAG: Error-prone repair homolog of DNA polymerase III alpha subunit, partial [uncultured Solirubrobacteraceae bacterium]